MQVPHAPTLPYLANTNDDDSSDPEDVADTSLFNAVYTDLLATEQARQSAETFTVGLSDSDDESDGDSVDMLSGQVSGCFHVFWSIFEPFLHSTPDHSSPLIPVPDGADGRGDVGPTAGSSEKAARALRQAA